MAIRVLRSSETLRNPALVECVRGPDEDNGTWLRRVVDAGHVDTGAESSVLLLVGGADPLSFRLRVAQSHVRHDLSPSAWSHVAFVEHWAGRLAELPVREVSLHPLAGFGSYGYAPTENGLQRGRLGTYFDALCYRNIALLCAPVPAAVLGESLERISDQRSVFDVPQLILRWLTYGWGVGVPASPLAEGYGVPAAAVLEAAFAANGFDLTPGLESRSSCPEAIWQAAGYWYGYHQRVGEGHSMKGAFSAKHDLLPTLDSAAGPVQPVPASGATKLRAKRKRGSKARSQ